MAKTSATIDVSSLKVAGERATGYITDITNGICVHEDDDNWDEATGDAVKITDNEVDVLQGGTPVASFGTSGAQIGVSDGTQSYLQMDYHSIQAVDKEGNPFFYVSDLRDANGNITEQFDGDGSTTAFTVEYIVSSVAEVTVNGTEQTIGTDYTRSGRVFTFTTAPSSGEIVQIKYLSNDAFSEELKAYTLGVRYSGAVGVCSVAEGYENIASGSKSHAEGYYNHARGACSHAEGYNNYAGGVYSHVEGVHNVVYGGEVHAEGYNNQISASAAYSHAEGRGVRIHGDQAHAQNLYTIAGSPNQTALGKYNIADTSSVYAVIVGNGTSDTARSNALTVDWDGNVNIPSGAEYKINNTSIFDLIYPVGSIYMSVNSTSPVTLFGGEWQPLQNRFLLGAGSSYTAGATGGSANAIIPYHRHSVDSVSIGASGAHTHDAGNNQAFLRYNQGTVSTGVQERSVASGASGNYKAPVVNNANVDWSYLDKTSSETHTHTVPSHNTNYAGTSGNTTGANMPPYLVVYMWKRTA